MKAIIKLLFICLIINNNWFIGQIINPSFETWQTVPNSNNGEDPEEWRSTNFMTGQSSMNAISKTNDAYDSSWALKIEPLISPSSSEALTASIYNGFPKDEDFLTPQFYFFSAGTPLNYKPQKITGYYKYNPNTNNNDSAYVIVSLKRQEFGQNLVALGKLTFSPVADYTYFEVNVTNAMQSLQPDSMIIAFFYKSNNSSANPTGNYLIVDKLGLEGELGLEESNVTDLEQYIYPNPFQESFSVKKNENQTWILTDINGNVICSEKNQEKLNSISKGIYVLQLIENKLLISRTKVVKN